MEPFPDLSTLSDEQLAASLREREEEEAAISYRRRLLHGRIDLLRGELVARLRRRVDEGTLETPAAGPGRRPLFEGTGDVPEEHDLEPIPDLETLSTDDLRATIRDSEREEDDLSLRRRVLHGQIDILRAERARRLRGDRDGIEPDDLAAILAGKPPSAR